MLISHPHQGVHWISVEPEVSRHQEIASQQALRIQFRSISVAEANSRKKQGDQQSPFLRFNALHRMRSAALANNKENQNTESIDCDRVTGRTQLMPNCNQHRGVPWLSPAQSLAAIRPLARLRIHLKWFTAIICEGSKSSAAFIPQMPAAIFLYSGCMI